MDKMIGKMLGKYQVESLIAEGQMTAVYRAVENSQNKTVAVKIFRPKLKIDPEIVKRFKAEAGLLSAIYHPSKMKIHGFGEQDGIFYLVMDYLPGGNLEDRLGVPMPVEVATDIMHKIVRALEESKAIGVTHGNIKPSNILFSETGIPVVTDFRIDCIQDDLDPMSYATQMLRGLGRLQRRMINMHWEKFIMRCLPVDDLLRPTLMLNWAKEKLRRIYPNQAI